MKTLSRFTATLLLLLMTLAVYRPAQAQYMRPGDSFFIRPHVGISSYLGDNEESPVNFNFDAFKVGKKVPFSVGLELGYQFSPSWSLSGAYFMGDYPIIYQVQDRLEPYEDDNTIRHTMALLLRHTFMAEKWRVAPYLQGGFNASFGTADRLDNKIGYGPSVGAGLDIALSGRTSLMLEWNANTSFPDRAIDATADRGFGNFDVLSSFGAGLKFNFNDPFVPVRVLNIAGPDTLVVGDEGLFTAAANIESATLPVDYTWAFGDGASDDGLTASHRYTTPGTYTVTFTAVNKKSTDAASMLVTVVPEPLPANIITLGADNLNPDTRTPVTFWAEVVGDLPMVYDWDFGNGVKGTDLRPMQEFPEPGIYTVTLRVANAAGYDEETLVINVAPYVPAYCIDIVEMNTVFFKENDSILTEEGKTVLMDNVEIMTDCPSAKAEVLGWAAPGERMPDDLSTARAAAVKAFYVGHGIDADRIDTQGMGVADEATTKKVNGSRFRRADTRPLR